MNPLGIPVPVGISPCCWAGRDSEAVLLVPEQWGFLNLATPSGGGKVQAVGGDGLCAPTPP